MADDDHFTMLSRHIEPRVPITPPGSTWCFARMANEADCVVVWCEGRDLSGGEVLFRWHDVDGALAARLEVFDDGWRTLWASGLVEVLASLGGASLDEMCAHLRAYCFQDRTAARELGWGDR